MEKIPGYLLLLSMVPNPLPHRRVSKCLLHIWIRKTKGGLHQTEDAHENRTNCSQLVHQPDSFYPVQETIAINDRYLVK